MIVTIIGARPQFIKASVISMALAEAGIKEDIIHTGQHYDTNMSDVFWDELGIPKPSINLNIGSGSHGAQTAMMIQEIEKFILNRKETTKAILLYGDTNSTLAGAIVGSKLNDVKVIHIEAGLRSFNKSMPEEVNRIMTDHVSDLLFCSSEIGVNQLKKEGILSPIYNVGDVMYDAVNTFLPMSKKAPEALIKTPKHFSLLTLHRPSNTDKKETIQSILDALGSIEESIIWPVHPRVKKQLDKLNTPDNIIVIEPVSYMNMLNLLDNCSKVFTDSGGLQKEAYWLKKQCITLRKETEWVETLEGGWNTIVHNDPKKIIDTYKSSPNTPWKPIYGHGDSSQKIVALIQKHLNNENK